MAKKLTIEEFDRQVREALTEPLPGQNGQRRLRLEPGTISKLLKKNGGVAPPTTTQQGQ